jgi:PAS domain S-box-containing protein
MTPTPQRLDRQDELERAMQAFAGISESLLASYRELAQRAEHVEEQLARANAELEAKVDELAATRAHLEAILRTLPTGVVVRDARGRITSVNDAAVELLGCPAEKVLGRRSHPVLAGKGADGAVREVVREDGGRLVVVSRLSTIRGADGRKAGSVEILDDRTELSELTERLHRADKMAALGTMAGGIAHEIRNPMNAIKGFAELLRRELDETTRAHRWATTISAGVDEVERIISSMQTLAHPEQLRRDAVDAAQLVERAVAAAFQVLPQDADRSRWPVTTSATAPTFLADRIKMRHALRNLIANAIEVQPEGGPIAVEVREHGGDVLLSVADGGPGIPPELRQRIFDPFFTTRPQGTGLGLALVHTIVELHGGRVEIDHENAQRGGALRGARITLRIPFTEAR